MPLTWELKEGDSCELDGVTLTLEKLFDRLTGNERHRLKISAPPERKFNFKPVLKVRPEHAASSSGAFAGRAAEMSPNAQELMLKRCVNKVPFRTEADARDHAERNGQEKNVTVYCCQYCMSWHFASVKA